MSSYKDVVPQLQDLLEENEKWSQLLLMSIFEATEKARQVHLKNSETFPTNLSEYFDYLNNLVTWRPIETYQGEIFDALALFYWLLDQPTGRELQENKSFRQWMVDFANDWGSYLNTTDSINSETIKTFEEDPSFMLEQYDRGPSGWLTFNQFFGRQVKPGLRPVAGIFDDRIINSPADATFREKFHIDHESEITVKFTHRYRVQDLLKGSPYQDRFQDGLFMHSFLGPQDYHRFHAPVRGTVVECRAVQENVTLDVELVKDEVTGKWHFSAPDGTGYQFTQTRGIIIFDAPIGLVAVLPIGMAQVSSVNMEAVKGAYLNKGDEFGYFLFGGSDIIMLFENKSTVTISAAPGIHYNTGMCVGEVRW